MQRFAIIAAFAATATAHQVKIHNNCKANAYIWSCGTSVSEMATLKPGDDAWAEDFYTKYSDGKPAGGPSIYVSDEPNYGEGNIAQLEYFWQEDIQKIWWDLSLINGDPFGDKAVSLGSDLKEVPYDACKPVQCSGVGKCANVYHTSDQLEGTHDCPPSNLVMRLCDDSSEWSGGEGSGDNSGDDSSSEEAPAPAPSTSAPVVEAPSYTVAPVPEPVAATPESPAEPAPAAPTTTQQAAEVPANVHTAYATTIVTKVVKVNAAPSGVWVGDDGAVHGKREAHGHQAAHKNMKKHAHFNA